MALGTSICMTWTGSVIGREVELAIKQIMKKEGATERLKKENLMKWVRRVNGIKARVEEGIYR